MYPAAVHVHIFPDAIEKRTDTISNDFNDTTFFHSNAAKL